MLAQTAPRESILVVEDEPELAQLLQLNLDPMGYDVAIAPRLDAARRELRQREHALVILDLGLPDGDGLDLCRELRQASDYTPILILTARSDETDRVVGLELGADDYLVKPFAVRELAARVKAIRRRVAVSAQLQKAPERQIVCDELVVEPAGRRVTLGGAPIDLTASEFDLLLHLASNPGRVYTRAQLLEQVWGDSFGAQEHAVNAQVNRLRAKIEADPTEPHYVRTVWGVGYRFHDPRDSA